MEGKELERLIQRPVNANPVANNKKDWVTYLGRFIVVVDTIPKTLLSFTLVEDSLLELGWFRFVLASICFGGNLFSVYKLFSPYIIGNMKSLPGDTQKLWRDRSCAYFKFTPLVVVNLTLTLNAVYIFSGMNIEGVNATAKMFSKFSEQTSGSVSGMFRQISYFLSHLSLKISVVIFNMLVTSLAFSAIHKHFILDIPADLYHQLGILFENSSVQKKRAQLLSAIDAYIKQCEHGSESLPANIELIAGYDFDNASLGQNYDLARTDLDMHVPFSTNPIAKATTSLIVSVTALYIFYIGTYCMKGNAQTISDNLFGEGVINPTVTEIMSIATRLSITAIWYENGFPAIKQIARACWRCNLGVHLDNNYVRIGFFILASLSGLCSSIVLVHSVIIALQLNHFEAASFFGISSIISAAFGTTIGDGAPTFNSIMDSHTKSIISQGNHPNIRRYKAIKWMRMFREQTDKAETSSIESLPFPLDSTEGNRLIC